MKRRSYTSHTLFFVLPFLISPVVNAATSEVTPGAATTSETAIQSRNLPYTTLGIGAQSGCDRPAKMLVSDEQEWQRVWQKHTRNDDLKMSAPPVDWTEKAVVILLGGEQGTGAGIEVQRVIEQKDQTTVYFVQSKGADLTNAAGPVKPFHFALIAKPRNAVRFVDGNTECSVCVVTE
jgi:hypothetical protein